MSVKFGRLRNVILSCLSVVVDDDDAVVVAAVVACCVFSLSMFCHLPSKIT